MPAETTAAATPVSDQKLAANRANAAKSTGPRTPAGKHRAAQNARTHGLSATTPPTDLPAVPDPCAQLTFTTTLQELIEEHRPATPTQLALVRELALTLWKLDYAPRVEHRLLNTPLPDENIPRPNPAHITPHPRLDHDADPTATVLAAHFASDHPTPLTRFFAHLNRLQARTHSLLNQLRRLHRDQQTHREDDDGTTWQRAYTQRTQADHTALQEESRRIHQDNQRHAAEQMRQTTPNNANAHQTTPSPAPVQNEPMPVPADPPPPPACVVAPPPDPRPLPLAVSHPAPAQPGATERNTAQQLRPPAQNEPTSSPSLLSVASILGGSPSSRPPKFPNFPLPTSKVNANINPNS